MSSTAVAVTVGNGMVVVQKSTGDMASFYRPGPEFLEDLIVTHDGSFVTGGAALYAIGDDGAQTWTLGLAGGPPIDNEWSQCRLQYSADRNVLIAVCNSGFMYGIDLHEPRHVVWQRQIYTEGSFDVYPAPSLGDRPIIWFSDRFNPAGAVAVDSQTGRNANVLVPATDWVWVASHGGLLVRSFTSGPTLIDTCGGSIWRTNAQGNQLPMIVGQPEDRVFGVEKGSDGLWRPVMLSLRDGGRLASASTQGTPVAAGADGVFYAVSCDNKDPVSVPLQSPPELIAYSKELVELWRVAIAVPVYKGVYACPRPAVALDGDGIMYLAAEADGTYLIAMQTQSPGIASAGWPLRFHDHSGSLWID